MRISLLLFFITLTLNVFAQPVEKQLFKNDSLLVIPKRPEKGFYHDYILFIPKETPVNKEIVLLVEPNNTGKTNDSIEVHKEYAIDLASVSSVGNNVSTMLKIPLLVPIFPRPASDELMYTHALDRDVMLEKSPEFKRLDLQLIAMINDSRKVLESMEIEIAPKIFMSGFSASATFTNRFSLIHPEVIQGLAIGGFNGELMLPQPEINGVELKYPLGTKDFKKLFGGEFDLNAFRDIPQYIYMGKLDDNDAVQFDDAYSEKERKIINYNIGDNVQERFLKCQLLYEKQKVFPVFKNWDDVGHWTTSAMNFEVIKFFFHEMQKNL